jgi:hypothetical protein
MHALKELHMSHRTLITIWIVLAVVLLAIRIVTAGLDLNDRLHKTPSEPTPRTAPTPPKTTKPKPPAPSPDETTVIDEIMIMLGQKPARR